MYNLKKELDEVIAPSLITEKDIGNINNKKDIKIDTKRSAYGADFLIRFEDALENRYYRYQSFEVNEESTPVEATVRNTVTAKMEPSDKVYAIYLGSGGFCLQPISDIEDGDVSVSEGIHDTAPDAVAMFNSPIPHGTVGTFGDPVVFVD